MLDEGQKEFYEKGIEQFDKAVFDDKNNEIDFLTVASEEPYANKTKEEYIIYSHDKKYNIKQQLSQFLEDKGQILACGTCLKARQKGTTNSCPMSTMKDLLEMVEESDKILTFG